MISGDFDDFLKDPKTYLDKGLFQNFADDKLFIKPDADGCLGLQAVRDIGAGEFLIVEQALVSSKHSDSEKSKNDLVKKCQDVLEIGGHRALRLSYLKSSDSEKLSGDLPQIEVFYQTLYRKYKMKQLNKQQIKDIVSHNIIVKEFVYEQAVPDEQKATATKEAEETKEEEKESQDKTKA